MLKQTLQQKLLQKLSPQQIQLMKLLQVPTMELEQRIKEEIENNPALEEGAEEDELEFSGEEGDMQEDAGEQEEDFDLQDYFQDDDIPYYKTVANNKGPDDEEREVPISGGISFHDNLLRQLQLKPLNEREQEVAKHLIGSLDDAGYLTRELENIVDDLAFSRNITTSEEELKKLLGMVQELEPAGIGARNLRECLLLQLERKDHERKAVCDAEKILEEEFDAFSRKHYDKIKKKLDLDDEALREAVNEITRLNPKPGGSLRETARPDQSVTPDFIITIQDNDLELTLNSRNAPDLKVNSTYKNMLEKYAEERKKNKEKKQAFDFVKQKLDSAKWFIEAVRQRQQTLLLTMHAIMDLQRKYFLTGDETKLKPMILKDVADIVGLDISTVSRVANSKYVQTPYGTFSLKSFFSESLSTQSGEEVSTREVKKILQDHIDSEDKKKPLTDEKLTQVLKEKGYNIARRTVAKYREQLGVPVARLRKEV